VATCLIFEIFQIKFYWVAFVRCSSAEGAASRWKRGSSGEHVRPGGPQLSGSRRWSATRDHVVPERRAGPTQWTSLSAS